jgi:hypothetical protein
MSVIAILPEEALMPTSTTTRSATDASADANIQAEAVVAIADAVDDDVAQAALDSAGVTAVVHVIQSSYHHTDRDNRRVSTDEILTDEGWFVDRASAQIRCAQLNAKHQAFYTTRMDILKRERQTAIRAAEKKNREAAAIRGAGMSKSDVPVPAPFTPESFADFFSKTSYVSYEPIEIRRSDHDGIARAAGSGGPAGSDESNE